MKKTTYIEAGNALDAILVQPDPTLALIRYVGSGDMAKNFPELQELVEFKTKGVSKHLWSHVLQVVKNVPADNLVLRWAALFHDVGKPATLREEEGEVTFYGHEPAGEKIWYRVAGRMNIDKTFKENVGLLIRHHLKFSALTGGPGLTPRAIRRFLKLAGDQYENLYSLAVADITSANEEILLRNQQRCADLKKRIAKLIEDDKKVAPKLPKGAGHILWDALGLSGPELGRVMGLLTEKLRQGEEITLVNIAHKAALLLMEEKDGEVK